MRRWRIGTVAAIGIAGLAFAALATAGKGGRTQVVKDPTDRGGKFYDAETYARCDIKEIKATVKRNKLVVKVTHRGKQASSSHQLNLNTRGGKRSDPEYYLRRGVDTASLTEVKDSSVIPDAAKVKLKNRKKAIQYELPLRRIGRPKKTGFQAQTCGEGAVDIAPGGSYYDDTSWDGTIDYQYKNIKTGR